MTTCLELTSPPPRFANFSTSIEIILFNRRYRRFFILRFENFSSFSLQCKNVDYIPYIVKSFGTLIEKEIESMDILCD